LSCWVVVGSAGDNGNVATGVMHGAFFGYLLYG